MKDRAETTFEKWALNLPRAQLGGLIKDYIGEANHNGWDGFDRRDLTGIRKFLADLMLYHDHSGHGGGDERPEDFATKITNLNPVP
jgi:hypothetical protein